MVCSVVPAIHRAIQEIKGFQCPPPRTLARDERAGRVSVRHAERAARRAQVLHPHLAGWPCAPS